MNVCMISAISATNINFNGKRTAMRRNHSLSNEKQICPKQIFTKQKTSLKNTLENIKNTFSNEAYLSKLPAEERKKVEQQWEEERLADQIAFILLILGALAATWVPLIIAVKRVCSLFK